MELFVRQIPFKYMPDIIQISELCLSCPTRCRLQMQIGELDISYLDICILVTLNSYIHNPVNRTRTILEYITANVYN